MIKQDQRQGNSQTGVNLGSENPKDDETNGATIIHERTRPLSSQDDIDSGCKNR